MSILHVETADPVSSELGLREQLSSLRGLLALSILMTERRNEQDILHLAATAVPGLVRCRAVGVYLQGQGWDATTTSLPSGYVRADVAAQLDRIHRSGGSLAVPGQAWAWGLPLSSLDDRIGHLVVAGPHPPSPSDLLLLRSLAQQTGIAISNARVHASKQATNAALAETVAALQRKTAIHDRFTQVALNGGGREGIVQALSELTGLPAAIEDRAGNVLAWAGAEPARPKRPVSARRREQLVDRAVRAGRPIRADGRLLTVARPRSDIVGVLLLTDPDEAAGEQETVALEHGATVLAIELARLLSIAETEMRLGVNLVADLISGTDEGCYPRAQAVGHDLTRPHRVVVIGSRHSHDQPEELLADVREALSGHRPPLLMHKSNTVVALAPTTSNGAEAPWERLSAKLDATAAGSRWRIGVGGVCRTATDYPRSYREALLALRLAGVSGERRNLVVHDDLGVYQLLSDVADPGAVDTFVTRWLGTLQQYDARRGTNLVQTLSRYLDTGGNYDATAEAMALGRSTIRYRLGRIREISGHNLADPDTRFQLQLATRAWFTLQSLKDL